MTKILKVYSLLLYFLLCLLGFTACDKDDDNDDKPEYEVMPMYGVVSTSFEEKNSALSTETTIEDQSMVLTQE